MYKNTVLELFKIIEYKYIQYTKQNTLVFRHFTYFILYYFMWFSEV